MYNFLFWQKWLLVVSILITVFGILLVVSSFFGGSDSQIDPSFLRDSKIITFDAFRQWIYAVLGATMAGWGICLIFVTHYPFKRKEWWAWNCLTAGLSLWFVLDTIFSVYARVYFNATFNAVLFGLFLLPLIFPRRHFV